ncbi:stemmadenine O-acetyltransferase-like [Euphorbia lathyris]|uniref:stemmadenine O-acetyltransferase-like n=1 Tax=Euphorbia lathyris TaxID=212925 RepID=UPI003313422B
MEVQIISKECIKPCSSTPSHLKTFNISLLDQFLSPIFYCIALFYPNSISQSSLLLKHSLSKTLTQFYPLAGKIKDHLSIDCNDEGALYIEAKSNIPLSSYLTQPDLTLLPKLVPDLSPFLENPTGAFLLRIQQTTFTCGALALGLSVSHMALDGTAFASFIKAWALTASSSAKQLTNPNLDAPITFPQRDSFPKEAVFSALWSPYLKKGKVIATRLMFVASALDKLKADAASSTVEKPSRVEVVSAVICKSVMAAFNAPISIIHLVNVRGKATPPFPDCSLGNFVWLAPVTFREKDGEVSNFVGKIRNAVRKIDSDFVKKIGCLKVFEEVKVIESEVSEGKEVMLFTSWLNFGVYKNSDFGWGNPIWIAPCNRIDSEEIEFNNVCILNDTKIGNGVEAWVYLPQDVAVVVEKDAQLLQYASINPTPL